MPYSGDASLEQKFIWVQRSCFFLHATLVACSDIEDSLAFKYQTWYYRATWSVFSFFSSSTYDFSGRQWNDLWYLKQWKVFHSNYWTKNCLFPGYIFCFALAYYCPDTGKCWGQEENGVTGDEIIGCYHWPNGYEFEQTLGDSEGQESLVFCSP